jgi:hypothetical protein
MGICRCDEIETSKYGDHVINPGEHIVRSSVLDTGSEAEKEVREASYEENLIHYC